MAGGFVGITATNCYEGLLWLESIVESAIQQAASLNGSPRNGNTVPTPAGPSGQGILQFLADKLRECNSYKGKGVKFFNRIPYMT